MKINYSDLFAEIKRVSAYEGKGAVDANGQSVFTETVVTDHEQPIIYAYFRPIAGEIRQTLNSAIKDVTVIEGDSATFVFHGDFTSLEGSASLRKRIFDLMVNYAIRNWLTEKKSARAEFYMSLVTDMLSQLPRFVAGLIYEDILPDSREGGASTMGSRAFSCGRPTTGKLYDAAPISVAGTIAIRVTNPTDNKKVYLLDQDLTAIAESTAGEDLVGTVLEGTASILYVAIDNDASATMGRVSWV